MIDLKARRMLASELGLREQRHRLGEEKVMKEEEAESGRYIPQRVGARQCCQMTLSPIPADATDLMHPTAALGQLGGNKWRACKCTGVLFEAGDATGSASLMKAAPAVPWVTRKYYAFNTKMFISQDIIIPVFQSALLALASASKGDSGYEADDELSAGFRSPVFHVQGDADDGAVDQLILLFPPDDKIDF